MTWQHLVLPGRREGASLHALLVNVVTAFIINSNHFVFYYGEINWFVFKVL